MEYTVKALADLSGVTPRTLRYYHKIELLVPEKTTGAGYRLYGEQEVNRLQQILFYRELDMGLDAIKDMLSSPAFQEEKALEEHCRKLQQEKKRLEELIKTIKKTISSRKGRIVMTDREKFQGFTKSLVEENEKKYGKEIREKYGDKTVNESNEKLLGMTPEQYEELTALTEELAETLKTAMETNDPAGELGQKTAGLHKKWLSFYWSDYSKEAHAGVVMLYTQDERFTAYYDKIAPGAAKFLQDAVLIYTGQKK